MWNRRVDMGGGQTVIMHSNSAIVHYPTPNTGTLDLDNTFSHPKSVMRGFAEVDKVENGELSLVRDKFRHWPFTDHFLHIAVHFTVCCDKSDCL